MNTESRIGALIRAAGLIAAVCLLWNGAANGQCCAPVPNAIPGISLSYVQGGGTNASGVGHNPNFDIYYAMIAGNAGFPMETFDNTGAPLYQTNTGFDVRGIWWNPGLNQLESNGFNTFGWWSFDMNASGWALNTGTSIFPGLLQPNSQSCGDLDYDANEVIYFNSGNIHRYDRATGAFIAQYPLVGIPTALSDINITTVVYTGCAGYEIGIEDFNNKRIYFFDKSTGAYSGMSQLPPATVTNNAYRFSYANNLAWLYDVGTRTWFSFQVLSSSMVTANILGADTTLCTGDSLVLDATTPTATYLWNDASTGPTLTANVADTFWVEVTAMGCTMRDSIIIAIANPPVVNLGLDTTLCNSDSLVLDVTTPGATYTWQDASTDSVFTVNAAGTYWVDVSLGGCGTRDSIDVAYTVVQPDLGSDTTLCQGDSLFLDVTTAGASYFWQDASATATQWASTAGIYWVDVAVGVCSVRDSISVGFTTLPVVNFGPDVLLCENDSMLLDATWPSATYQWQDASTDSVFMVTAPGTYWVLVSDGGCTDGDSIAITYQIHQPELGPDTALCDGETLLLDATILGATYSWHDASTFASFNVSVAGTYWVDATISGCTKRDTIVVTYNPIPVVNLGGDTTVCAGQDLPLDATAPGATYLWQDNSVLPTFLANTAGNYSVDVTINGCVGTDDINLAIDPGPVVNIGPNTTLCNNDSLQLDASTPGGLYAWHDASTVPTFMVNSAVTAWVDVTVDGCTNRDSIEVAYINFQPDIGPDSSVCVGESVLLDATTAGATYNWQNNTANATLLASTSGIYWVDVTVGLCTRRDSAEITIVPLPVVDLGPDRTICQGDVEVLDATIAGGSYTWQDASSSPTFTVTDSGIYWVQVTGAAGCVNADTLELDYFFFPPDFLGNDTALCENEKMVMEPTLENATYQWYNGFPGPTHTVTTSGSYWVLGTIGACSWPDTIEVLFKPLPSVYIGEDDTAKCVGELVDLDATTSNGTYEWQDGTSQPVFNAVESGVYSVLVTVDGCTHGDTISLDFIPPPYLPFPPDTVLCYGKDWLMDATNAFAEYRWHTMDTVPTYYVDRHGIYSVEVRNICGFESTTTNVTYGYCGCDVFVPNSFSPNGDGKNDVFLPQSNCDFEDMELTVYNRWGELLFTTEDPLNGWDGKFAGNVVHDGVYVYKIIYKNKRGEGISKGHVVVLH